MSILALIVGFAKKGLRMSNSNIADFLNVDRRSVIRAIGRLKSKDYIQDIGKNNFRRKLTLKNSGGLSPFNSDSSVTKTVTQMAQNSDRSVTHNIRKKRNKDSSAFFLQPSAGPVASDDYSRFGTHPVTPEEIEALERDGLI